jgi:hypothetical protein
LSVINAAAACSSLLLLLVRLLMMIEVEQIVALINDTLHGLQHGLDNTATKTMGQLGKKTDLF